MKAKVKSLLGAVATKLLLSFGVMVAIVNIIAGIFIIWFFSSWAITGSVPFTGG